MAGMDHKDFRALLPCRSHARCVQRQVPLVLETVQAQFSDKVARARVVIRHVPMVPETVQAQFLDKVVCWPVLCNDTCSWCFVAMVVFSAMRGSTVALGDDFLELVVLSAILCSTLDTCSLVRCDVVWWWKFFSRWCLRFCVGQRLPMKGKYTINYIQYQDVVGCVCMLKDWISSCCVFAPTTTTTSSSS